MPGIPGFTGLLGFFGKEMLLRLWSDQEAQPAHRREGYLKLIPLLPYLQRLLRRKLHWHS
jgi:hypothetical protein